MRIKSVPVLIVFFIAFLGLICSHSISYSSKAFATKDDSSGSDDSSRDSFATTTPPPPVDTTTPPGPQICPDGSSRDANGNCSLSPSAAGTATRLLDTAQLCQLAGDTQCVAKQNQFKTLNLVTKLDSTGRTWTISGQTENIAARTKSQGNVQIVAYFYDSKGNNVGGFYKGVVNPGILKSLQSGAFNIKASTSAMKGTPSFFRLEYQTSSI